MIKNTPHKSDPRSDLLRGAIEHRATWFALMIDEAKKEGLKDDFAGRAAFRCGQFQGATKYPKTTDLQVFAKAFANDDVIGCFEMEKLKDDGKELNINFHYCPLVAAWKKLGIPDEDLPKLCEMAMKGDRGIISQYEGFEFNLGDTIAKGNDVCEIRIKKNK